MSSSRARHMKMDLKDFYLKLSLLEYEHVRIKLSKIPKKIAEEWNSYNLMDIHGCIHAEFRVRMNVLPQAG